MWQIFGLTICLSIFFPMVIPAALLTFWNTVCSARCLYQANATVDGGKLALRWGDKVRHKYRRASEEASGPALAYADSCAAVAESSQEGKEDPGEKRV